MASTHWLAGLNSTQLTSALWARTLYIGFSALARVSQLCHGRVLLVIKWWFRQGWTYRTWKAYIMSRLSSPTEAKIESWPLCHAISWKETFDRSVNWVEFYSKCQRKSFTSTPAEWLVNVWNASNVLFSFVDAAMSLSGDRVSIHDQVDGHKSYLTINRSCRQNQHSAHSWIASCGGSMPVHI